MILLGKIDKEKRMYFKNINSIDEAKKLFRELSKNLHPDHGGNEEDFKKMKNEYDNFLKTFVNKKFTEYNNNGFDFTEQLNEVMKVLKIVIDFNMSIEVIGKWIYARQSYEYKDNLKNLGFWFSGKHKAWIFSGGEKSKKMVTKLGIDTIREIHGSRTVKDKTDTLKLAY